MDELPLPVLEELILARLPLRSLLAIAAACKRLRCIVFSPSFSRLLHSLPSASCSSPWFFFFGFNHLLPHCSQAFAFDPTSLSWLRLPLSPPPPHNSSSLSASNGSLFALSGARQARLCIAPSPLKQNWQVIQPLLHFGRRNPMVGIFYNDPCTKLDIASIVVAGGVDEDEEGADELSVEEYHMKKGEWERREPLPEELRGRSVISTMVGGRFYVGEREGGGLWWRERGEEAWRGGRLEMPREVKGWQWVGSEEEEQGIIGVAVCEGSNVKVYRLEQVEGGVAVVRKVAEMPEELRQLFEEEGAEMGEEVALHVRSCAGGRNLVYVYTDSPFKEYAACACKLVADGVGSRWYRLPPLPSPLHRFDKVTSTSTIVPLVFPTCNTTPFY